MGWGEVIYAAALLLGILWLGDRVCKTTPRKDENTVILRKLNARKFSFFRRRKQS